MLIRSVIAGDLEALVEIDGTVESSRYVHVDGIGEKTNLQWKLEDRPLRSRLIEPHPLTDEQMFAIRQIVSGADEGVATLVEHDNQPVALLLGRPDAVHGTMKLLDVRVDFEHRREGLATALLYQLIQTTREAGHRAIVAETLTNNSPANELLGKLGFELAGLDTRRRSNHDLVKEAVTLFWYLPLD